MIVGWLDVVVVGNDDDLFVAVDLFAALLGIGLVFGAKYAK